MEKNSKIGTVVKSGQKEGTPSLKGKNAEGVSRQKGIPAMGKTKDPAAGGGAGDGAVKEKKKRGGKITSIKDNLQNVKEGDISRVVRESYQYFNRKPVKTDEECVERLNDYFRQCHEEGQIPTVEDMALALGVTRSTLWDWENGRSQTPSRSAIIKKAKEIMAGMDAKLVAEGKIPQVVYIFRAKNYYGMRDQQDVVVTPNVDPMGDRRNAAELAQKYIDSTRGTVIEDKLSEVNPDKRLTFSESEVVDANYTDVDAVNNN